MSGNGFKLGSNFTPKSPDIRRTADYCVCFDNKGKGFDNNHTEKCTGSFTNCVSFNNHINYTLPYTFSKWSNNWVGELKNLILMILTKPLKKLLT